MAIDFRDYNDPGVYVEALDTGITLSPGIEPTIVAFIGTSPDSKVDAEYSVVPTSGQRRLNTAGIVPGKVQLTDRPGIASYASGAIGSITTDMDDSYEGNDIFGYVDRYIKILPGLAGTTFPVTINGVAYTLTVSSTDYLGTDPSWDLVAVDTWVDIPIGSVINLATTYSSPSILAGQTLESSPDIYDWDVSKTYTDRYPEIAESLCIIGYDVEANATYSLAQGTLQSGDDLILEFKGESATIAFDNATADAIQAALEDLPDVGVANVAVIAVDPSLVDGSAPTLADTNMSIRFIGDWLPIKSENKKNDTISRWGVSDPLTTTADNAHVSELLPEYIIGAETGDDGAVPIAPGDILQIDGERVLLLEDLSTLYSGSGVASGPIAGWLVQRGFQNTAFSKDISPPQYHSIWKLDSPLNSDYGLIIEAGLDSEISTTYDNMTVISIVDDGTSNVPRFGIGTHFVANIRVTDDVYYAPRSYTRDRDVYEDFGNPFIAGTNIINSDVSLAAQLAFANGANEIVICPVNPEETDSEVNNWTAAVDRLRTAPSVNTIVPLIDTNDTTGAALADYIQYEIAREVGEGILRRAFFAFNGISGALTSDDYEYAAKSWKDYRISLVAPSYAFIANTTSVDAKVPGYFVAAAVSARQSSLPPQMPLTRKQIYGFTAIESMDYANILDLQSFGVLVVWQDRLGRFIIKHGLTTDMSSAYTREISVVTARDRLRDLIFTTLDNGELIGSPMTARTPDMVLSGVTTALEEAKSTELIFEYGDIQYRINPIEPTAIEVRFAYKPTLPLNYIVVQFNIDTSLGTIAFQSINQQTLPTI